ncbi:MAG: SpaA isopeptide-forming pilin-related protein [Coriobacteriia bacterium]|nr:SpaA isopeptide-forming pilin-related protein [Coriobacteriia bacterium]
MTLLSILLIQTIVPSLALSAVPAQRRTFNTQSSHVGIPVHNSGTAAAYCLDFRRAAPYNLEMIRGTKLSRATSSEGRALSIALDLGPTTTSGGTTINGIALTNIEWRMAVQLAIFRIQGENLSEYSTSTDHWRASSWIVSRALSSSSVQLNRYWPYIPPSNSNVQRMVLSQGDPLTSRIRVQKRDAHSNAPLAGATFGIWTSRAAAASGNTSSPSFIQSSTSGSDGNAWWYRIPAGGSYYIREISAPPGYLLNATVLSVTPTGGDDSEATNNSLPSYLAGAIHNEPEPIGRIELNKQSTSPGNFISSASIAGNSAYSLAGAVYGVWTNSSAADTKNTSHTSYVGRMTTNVQGAAGLDGLRMGDYFIKEIIPPAGHILDATTHRVVLVPTGTSSPSIGRVSSSDARRYGTDLNIRKVDKETGQAIASGGASLAGAEFEIRWADSSAPDGWRTQQLITDASGHAEYRATGASMPGIPIGTFQIREVKAPEGYLIDPEFANWRSFNVADSGGADRPIEISLHNVVPRINEQIIRGDIALRKYTAPDGDLIHPLEKVRFHIIDDTPRNGDGRANPRYGQIVATLTTDREGFATSRDLIPPRSQWGTKDFSSGFLEYGDYILHEDPASTPEGLRPIDDMKFSVDENGVEKRYHLVNHEITAAISIVKRDAETGKVIPLAGTQFQIFDKDMRLMSFTINFPHTQTISTFTTDETGQINLPEPLKFGTYYLKEVQAPDGYLLLEEPIAFQVNTDHHWTDPLVVSIDNYPAMGKVRVMKVDSITASAVTETVFELRAKKDIVTSDGSVRLTAGDVADVLITNEKGVAESISLYLGDYELVEAKANPWYLLSPKIFNIELKYKDQHTAIVWSEVEVENEPVAVSCEVDKHTIKITSAGYKSLPGEAQIDNSAQGSKELYRYDVNFRSTSNDWADEYVVIDYLEGVNAGQIRIEELWTPVVWGDSNGLYNLWYQTNLSDETTMYSDSIAASKDERNPANPEKIMRFDNKGWKLWQEDLDAGKRLRLAVSDLNLEDNEHVTAIKLEYGRVEKGFTSKNDNEWNPEIDDRFYSEESANAAGLAPLSYLVYCPHPIEKYDPETGLENIILNSASSHITRNINLKDDDRDKVETRLIDSFTHEDGNRNTGDETSRESIRDTSKNDKDNPLALNTSPNTNSKISTENTQEKGGSLIPHSPKTGDQNNGGFWFALALAAACAGVFALLELAVRKRDKEKKHEAQK